MIITVAVFVFVFVSIYVAGARYIDATRSIPNIRCRIIRPYTGPIYSTRDREIG